LLGMGRYDLSESRTLPDGSGIHATTPLWTRAKPYRRIGESGRRWRDLVCSRLTAWLPPCRLRMGRLFARLIPTLSAIYLT